MKNPIGRFHDSKDALLDCLRRDGVVVVYVFGSVARGEADALSDVDIAVLLADGADDDAYLDVSADCGAVLGDDADIVVLNDAPLSLCFNVIRDGEVLYEGDRRRRVLFEADIMRRNYDVKYYRDRHVDKNLERIKQRGLT